MKILPFIAALALAAPALCFAGSPLECKSWPTNIAIVYLKNAGITDPTRLDESKTRAVRVASEKIGKGLWRDVYDITFHERGGRSIEVITSSQAGSVECSMSDPVVWVVSEKLPK
ncbi:hypothetical protein [Paraburkholderia sp. BL25I1N1]|uniref:hypothetical protein n=1 Tax=Paraburkholderia sp. BL25I1N1 TaxID=1938804 RepID=UPI000D08105A|nr:hypothetical protein [Paraburkholderia sp. BL25I1N1]PRY03030.1 hypothetical protein B0G73_11778 [Paraburkholderia sp. BL25I1N1]